MATPTENAHARRPRWWTDAHTSSWARVKDAIRRDWEQTKADLHVKGAVDDGQTIGETMREIAGKPPGAPRRAWSDVEEAVMYGHGARMHFGTYEAWDERLEATLRKDWEALKNGRGWNDVKGAVHHGWRNRRH